MTSTDPATLNNIKSDPRRMSFFAWNVVVSKGLVRDVEKYGIPHPRLNYQMEYLMMDVETMGLTDSINRLERDDEIIKGVEFRLRKGGRDIDNLLLKFVSPLDVITYKNIITTNQEKEKKRMKNKRKKANRKLRGAIPDPPMETPIQPARYADYPTNDPIEVSCDPTE